MEEATPFQPSATSIAPRSDWYEKKDVILLLVDEGREQPENIRVAQFAALAQETQFGVLGMKEGEGPNLWTVTLLDPIQMRNWNKLDQLPVHQDVVVFTQICE